jgi:hypothetical protein
MPPETRTSTQLPAARTGLWQCEQLLKVSKLRLLTVHFDCRDMSRRFAALERSIRNHESNHCCKQIPHLYLDALCCLCCGMFFTATLWHANFRSNRPVHANHLDACLVRFPTTLSANAPQTSRNPVDSDRLSSRRFVTHLETCIFVKDLCKKCIVALA